MTLGSTQAKERPKNEKWGERTELHELQILQPALGKSTAPPFGNTITEGIKVFPTHPYNIMAIKKAFYCFVHS